MSKENRRKLWTDRIKEYRDSGMTAVAWCEENNVSIHPLRSWITKFNKEQHHDYTNKNETEWLAVNFPKADIPKSTSPITVKIGAASIELTKGFDKDAFVEIIQVLSSLC